MPVSSNARHSQWLGAADGRETDRESEKAKKNLTDEMQKERCWGGVIVNRQMRKEGEKAQSKRIHFWNIQDSKDK